MINKLLSFYNFEKITKKEYKELNSNIHYFIGSCYKKHSGKFNIDFEDLNKKLFDPESFCNIEFLEKNCLKYFGISENTKDFKHLKIKDHNIIPCYENKKGSFYKLELENNLILCIHDYKDSSNTLTFKVVDILNRYKLN